MKSVFFKKSLAGVLLAAGALIAPWNGLCAANDAIDECAKDLLLSYFPEPIVTETLKKFDVPQDKWAGINKSLASKDKEIVKLVEQKAAAMNPNPLKDPQQRQAAVKLFRETLLQVFTDAMKDNDVTDTSKLQAMLDDIQQQKAKKFAMCMEKQKQKMQQMDKSDDKEADDDQDDDDDNDDDDADQESKSSAPQSDTSK